MTFSLQYELDHQRLISAVINDSRSLIPSLVGQDGNAVYAYAQAKIAQVVPGVLLYRIRTDQGNLSGILALQVIGGVASILFCQLRPGAQPFLTEILQIIGTFITSNAFLQDMLY